MYLQYISVIYNLVTYGTVNSAFAVRYSLVTRTHETLVEFRKWHCVASFRFILGILSSREEGRTIKLPLLNAVDCERNRAIILYAWVTRAAVPINRTTSGTLNEGRPYPFSIQSALSYVTKREFDRIQREVRPSFIHDKTPSGVTYR